MTTPDDPDMQASIARLVANGKMTREKAGQYVADDVTKKARGNIPDYDIDVVRRDLPHVLGLDFDEDKDGCYAMVEDGKLGEVSRVPMGKNLPETTEDLVRIVQEHYAGSLDNAALDKARNLFASFKGDDDGQA